MVHRIQHDLQQLLWLSTILLVSSTVGCGSSSVPNTSSSTAPASKDPSAPKGQAIADPLLRQARDEADTLLSGLLQGTFDQDDNLALVAEKLKGYTSWSVRSQTLTGPRTAEFKGTVSDATRQATFRMMLRKHASGNWTIGKFSGPTP